MKIRNIAELIILQCLEDLWNEKERTGSADFFAGEGFSLCAGLAGMDLHEQGRLLNMVGKTMYQHPGAIPESSLSVFHQVENFVPGSS